MLGGRVVISVERVGLSSLSAGGQGCRHSVLKGRGGHHSVLRGGGGHHSVFKGG